jgi:hypothetical protein
MKAAFGLRFLPAFFAFFFAISVSPLNETFRIAGELRSGFLRRGAAVTRRCTK